MATSRSQKPANKSSKPQPSSATKPVSQEGSPVDGVPQDTVTRLLKKSGIPLTRESYIRMAYWNRDPDSLSPEEESMLPEALQKQG